VAIDMGKERSNSDLSGGLKLIYQYDSIVMDSLSGNTDSITSRV
jgi:hypothetical protein